MPSLKQSQEDNNLFFLTIKAINGLPILISKDYYKIVLDSLTFCRQNKGIKIYAYTLLINHLHLVLKTLEGVSLDEVIRDFKRFTANKILQKLEQDNQHDLLKEFEISAQKTKKQEYKIWRRSCWPITINSEKFFWQKVKYTDLNAQKHGIVKDIEK